jgi:thiol-disulfide isomerase/thioredoxin
MTDPSSDPSPRTLDTPSEGSSRFRNFAIALVGILLVSALFLGLKTETAPGLLTAMAEESVPLETALTNGKPTLMEFYANWCTSCQAMAPELQTLKQNYSDRVNFVMLNVDNSKWLPEILKYQVDGIPHFVFLNSTGDSIAEAIGELPQSVMEANLVSLSSNETLPYANATGETSAFSAPISPDKASKTEPRSHSSQVQS